MSRYKGSIIYTIGLILLLVSNATYSFFTNNTFIKPIKPLKPLTTTQRHQVILGKILFNDKGLSKNKEMSCGTCHIASKSYADGNAFSKNNMGDDKEYNTPSIQYSVYNYYFGWTGKFNNLQEHLDFTITDKKSMNRRWSDLIEQLNNNTQYKQLFTQANYDSITPSTINDAIAQYQKTLAKPSRFDLFLLGDKTKLTEQELAGFNLFKSSGCISCHQGTNIGGNVRQKFGLMKTYFVNNSIKQRDLGLFNITKNKDDLNFFRVPSLRNVTKTAPYFHDASAVTIEAAISIMFSYQLGIDASEEDILSIKLFLESLETIQ